VEEFIEVGHEVNPTSRTSIRSVASTLAELIKAGNTIDNRHLEPLATGGPWRVDYSSEPWDLPAELEFLAVPVAAAQELYEPATSWARTLGHGDWRMPNMGFDASGKVVAVFDWDSLLFSQECWTVGCAASVVTSGAGGAPTDGRPPSLAVSALFVDEYELARGRPFSPAERRATAGALLYSLAAGAWEQFSELQKPQGMRREWLASGHHLETVRDHWQAYAALGAHIQGAP
jgi:hypothetical protein